MRKLLNTLYITTENTYLSLDGENVVVKRDEGILGRVPLHNIESIVAFGYIGASPSLMGKCAENNINLCFLKPSGKFLAKVTGKSYGNILLRKEQYRISDNEKRKMNISKFFIIGKLYNSKYVLERGVRDYSHRLDIVKLKSVSEQISATMELVYKCEDFDLLRGYEGEAAARYFSVFDNLILQQKEDFIFEKRVKRPPTDKVNALLSFFYTLLTNMCVSALEIVGLDPYCGFMHTDRPGRVSLALDLIEEMRAVMVDRFVLTIINKRQVSSNDFIVKENGAVFLTDDARKNIINLWQERKFEQVTHPYLNEKIEWGLIPYTQALLMARYIRGDIDEYPPYFQK